MGGALNLVWFQGLVLGGCFGFGFGVGGFDFSCMI